MTLYPPLWAQNNRYPAAYDRLAWAATVDGGVFGVADMKVGPRAAGTNMTVDIAAGRIIIPGPSGPYLCVSDAIENRGVASPPATNTSRVDLVVATVTDNQATGVGDPSVPATWDIQVITGTPAAASPQPPAVPANSVPLARIVVASTSASVVSSMLREARPCADRSSLGKLAFAQSSANFTVSSASFAAVTGTSVTITVIGHRWIELMWGVEIQGNTAGALCDGTGQINGVNVPGSYVQHRAQVAGGAGAETEFCSGTTVLDPGIYTARVAARAISYDSTWMAGLRLNVFDRGAATLTEPPLVPQPLYSPEPRGDAPSVDPDYPPKSI